MASPPNVGAFPAGEKLAALGKLARAFFDQTDAPSSLRTEGKTL
jgi:hypothetical protein